MAAGHFSHLVYHLPIGFKHIFHLVVTFVPFCPHRFQTHFSKRSLEVTLPLLTKPISQPPEDEFREVEKNLSKRQWVLVRKLEKHLNKHKIGVYSTIGVQRSYVGWYLHLFRANCLSIHAFFCLSIRLSLALMLSHSLFPSLVCDSS